MKSNLLSNRQADSLLDTEALASKLGCSIRAIQYLRAQGIGPTYIHISRRKIRYRWSDVQAWLDSLAISGNGIEPLKGMEVAND